MLKYFALLTGFIVLAMAQRPPYAGSPNRSYPPVLPQYLPKTDVNTINPVAPGIGERVGVSDDESSSPKYKPYDPYTDQELINRIKTWPKEQQPFWYLNREAIANQLANRTPSSSTTPPRGSFAGRLG